MFSIQLPRWAYETIGVFAAVVLLTLAGWWGMHEHDKNVSTQATQKLVKQAQDAQQAAETKAAAATAKAASDVAVVASAYQEQVNALQSTNQSLAAAVSAKPAVVRVSGSAATAACTQLRSATPAASGVDANATVTIQLPQPYVDATVGIATDADNEVGQLKAQIAGLQKVILDYQQAANGQDPTR